MLHSCDTARLLSKETQYTNMGTRPSFGTLFAQSRYSPHNAGTTRQSRQELFTVAGVAFLLKHDPAFRRTFLRNICGVAESDLSRHFEVEVQPARHADLRIRCAELQAVYIVEFKVGAPLQPNQDPTQEEAFLEQDRGYGWIIGHAPEYTDCLRRTYVVLQNWRAFPDHEVQGITVFSRAWKDLIVPPIEESALACDLLDTLGGWGITALRFRHHVPMKKAHHTQNTIDMFQIVTATAEELEIKPKHFEFDVNSVDESGGHFGLNVPFGLRRFTKLEKLAGQNDYALGWFGYGSDGGNATLDVWIYCKPSKAAETALAKTLEFAQKRLGTRLGASVEVEDGCVRISIGGDAVIDDKQWFASVFDALRDGAA